MPDIDHRNILFIELLFGKDSVESEFLLFDNTPKDKVFYIENTGNFNWGDPIKRHKFLIHPETLDKIEREIMEGLASKMKGYWGEVGTK